MGLGIRGYVRSGIIGVEMGWGSLKWEQRSNELDRGTETGDLGRGIKGCDQGLESLRSSIGTGFQRDAGSG